MADPPRPLGRLRPRSRAIAAALFAGATLLTAGLMLLAVLITRRSRPDLVAQMIQLASQDRQTPKGSNRRNVDFARSLAMLEARGALRRISDICCADRDGEGPADNGVLTVSLTGGRSPVVILYEDTRRTGYFRPGDAVLMVSRLRRSAADSANHGSTLRE